MTTDAELEALCDAMLATATDPDSTLIMCAAFSAAANPETVKRLIVEKHAAKAESAASLENLVSVMIERDDARERIAELERDNAGLRDAVAALGRLCEATE